MRRLIRPVACAFAAAALAAVVLAVVVNAVAASRGVDVSLDARADVAFALGVGAPACVGLVLLLQRPSGALAHSFPDGRLPSARWRPAATLALASGIGVVGLLPLQSSLEGPYGAVPNPLVGGMPVDPLTTLFWVCWFGLLLSLFGGALALRARYRAGGPEQRRQVLWLAYGALLLPLWLGGTSLVSRHVGGIEFPDLAVLMLAHVWLAVAVAVAVTRHGLYADRQGRLLESLPQDGRARSPIGRHDREVGVVLHDPALARRPDVLRPVLEAAAVAVELARLRVELRLRLAEVESSRTRIAQAGYEERRRLERDLHDGAQQRLVTLGIVLRRLRRSLPAEARILAPAFDAAVDEVAATIGDLRKIAAGLRPPRLDEGLTAALEDLARAAAAPVDLEATLRLIVANDGIGGAAPGAGSGLAGMLDRVAAQGGKLALDSPAGAGTRIAVELPCVS